MHWTEPATADDSHAALEKTLWDAANQLWSNAALKPSEYSPTVLGLIFLRYADVRFAAVKEEIQPQAGSRRKIGPTDFHAAGVVYLPDEARFSHLLSLPEGANVGQAVNEAMRAIEKENPDLADVLPKSYEGLNRIKITSGSGAGSSASLNFGGQATSAAGKFSLDFQGLNTTSKVFFSGQSPGAIGAWSTVDGREFAGYDSANGVQSFSAAGRPAQISTAPANSYVLGSGSQAALTGNKSLAGVTMPIGASLNLGGKELTIGGWIQNGSAGSISNGILKGDYIHFTTNSDLTTNTPVHSTVLLKNGFGTLTLNGSYVAGQCDVNTGTLALNLGSPMGSLQGQSTFVIGKSAGEIGSATLSLLGDNQFVSNPANVHSFVGVQVRGAGQFKLNGHNATVSFLQVNGGVVDMGGATVSTTNIYSSNPSSTGEIKEIKNGTLQLTSTSNPVRIENNTYQDALTVSSKVLSSGSLSKTGPGILVLKNASNSFGNGTLGLLLSEGTVALANSGASGSTNQSIQFDGGGLRGDSNGTLILTNPVTGGSIVTSGSDMTFSGGYRQTTYGGDFHVSNTLLVNGYAIDGGNNYSSKTGTGTILHHGPMNFQSLLVLK